MATANHILLRRITLSASASSITFDNIPQTGYTDLKIVASTRSANASAVDAVYGRFNSTSTGYTNRVLYGETTGVGSFSPVSAGTYAHLGYGVGANGTANTFSSFEFYIPNYTSSNYKSVSVDSVTETNASTYQSGVQSLEAVLWSNTAAITSITLTQESGGNFVAGSSFSLYGIANAATTPALAPKADGGDIIKTDGTYWYHAFTGSGVFKPQVNLTCDYLVVAGGGGGGGTGNGANQGYSGGGGGGAGGLRSTVTATGGGGSLESPISLSSSTTYAITVGSGGAGGTYLSGTSGNGTNSSIASLVVSTGGGGVSAGIGQNGGSGGGAYGNEAVGTGTSGQGYSGTQGTSGDGGTGGGGAGASPAAKTTNTGGAGGAGVAISAFASATGTGVSNYYAGGGGGGGYGFPSAQNGGAGGSGGGAAGGSTSANASDGIANTGGGGGGATARSTTVGLTGSNGGSGIVIIRYAV